MPCQSKNFFRKYFFIFCLCLPALPAQALDYNIKNDTRSFLFINGTSGNVGIGSSVPRAGLEILTSAGFSGQHDNGNSGVAKTIDWSNGNKQKITLTGNAVLTFTDPGVVGNYILQINQDATGSRSVTWPASVKWPGGNAPSLTGSAGAIDMVSFFYNGSIYLGSAGMDYR